MVDQKICCETGRVRVSYKIPVINSFTNNYTYYTANLKQTFVYKDRSRETGIEYGRVNVSYVSFPSPPYYLKAPIDLGFYRTQNEGDYQSIDSIDITLPKDQVIGSDGQSYFVGGYGGRQNAPRDFLTQRLVGYPEFPVHKYRCEILGYTVLSYLDGKCTYPNLWAYREIELPLVYDLRAWKDALNFVVDQISKRIPFAKLLKYLLFQRGCVIAVRNDNKVDIIFILETLVPIKLSFNPLPSLEYILLHDEFWAPSSAPPVFLFSIESPAGCPPPLVKLECCPETGCREQCPEGTCAVKCGDYICCYDKTGKSVKQFFDY